MPVLSWNTPLAMPGRTVVTRAPAPARPVRTWHTVMTPFRTYPIPAALAVVVQDVYPPRAQVVATGLLSMGSTWATLYREVGGVRRPVRNATAVALNGQDSLVRVDAELPFGMPVRYVLVVDSTVGTTELRGDLITVPLPGGKVVLSDAISGDSAEVIVTAWPDKTRSRNSSVFQVGGRNIVVAGQRGGFSSSVELYTETTTAAESLSDLLDGATAGVVQLRQPGGYDRTDCYISVLADTESRWSADGSDQRRLWSLDVVEVGPWADSLVAAEYTLQNVADAYTVGTLADLAANFPTLLDLAMGDFS